MDRLTNNINYCQLHCDFGKEKDCLFKDKSKCYENNMYNKLREYEIAEEQGLLLKLPCPIGTTVYAIYDNKVTKGALIRQSSICFLNDFGKTVFLTKEEAEQALAEKKGV